MPHTIALFDVDLTLLRVSTGSEIIAGALEAATGLPGLLDGFDFRGRSDRWLTNEVARVHGFDAASLFERYADAYTQLLTQALAGTPCSALPGATELLARLREDTKTTLGIATGNLRTNALVKLRHARLDHFFEPLSGGFGDEHEDRVDIVRAAAAACGHFERNRLVVVGDTVHDIRSALAVGATPIGVATGHATSAELLHAGATTVLSDLEDPQALDAILGRP